MAHAQMVEAYVEHLVIMLGGRGDGSGCGPFTLPFPADPVVEVLPGHADTLLRVRVRAAAVHDAEATGQLLAGLNDANRQLAYGRLYLHGSTVFAEQTLAGAWIELGPMRNAVHFVDWAAGRFGEELAEAAGGRAAVVRERNGRTGRGVAVGDRDRDRREVRHAAPGPHPGNTQVALDLDDRPLADIDDRTDDELHQSTPVNVAGYL